MQEHMTIDRLAELEQARTVAQRAAAEATERRNEAIRQLIEQGVTQQAIALRLGITAGRVSQIAARYPAAA